MLRPLYRYNTKVNINDKYVFVILFLNKTDWAAAKQLVCHIFTIKCRIRRSFELRSAFP
jgi:hypothetical protein